jgi:hypothetical protein
MRARVAKAYGRLPLSFEANQGQTDKQVKFLARGSGYSLFLTATAAVFSLSTPDSISNPSGTSKASVRAITKKESRPTASTSKRGAAVVRLQLLGANPEPKIVGLEKQAGRSHYFIGRERQRWHRNVSRYGKVKYEQVYEGVDMVHYGKSQQLEYDFVVAAGADPSAIKFAWSGAERVQLDDCGDLIIGVVGGELRQRRPLVYQESSGVRKEVVSRYVLHPTNEARAETSGSYEVTIALGSYDETRELVIDPEIDYSTYLGGNGEEFGNFVAVDSKGNAYVTGYTDSSDFPTEQPFQPANAGGQDAFVTKLSRDGDELVYSTYLGGSGDDQSLEIALDAKGNAYVTGLTDSSDFPTEQAFQPANGGLHDAFVTKLSRDGDELVYSTYLGGSNIDDGNSIAVDAKGNAYLTGDTLSSDFPTEQAFQPANAGLFDAFVTKLSRDGDELVYSTYLGGSGDDFGNLIVVDAKANGYVTGYTDSSDFPTEQAFQPANAGGFDAYVTKLSRDGDELVYSTYLGGSGFDEGFAIAVDGKGNAFVTGGTDSSDFPTEHPFQSASAGFDPFVSKLSRNGDELVYSTYLGGSGSDQGLAIAVDGKGNAFVAGFTTSSDFPTEQPFQPTNAGGRDAFVTKLSRDGDELVYSTYLGGSADDRAGFGIAVDGKGNAYVTGITSSTDFPTEHAFQSVFGGGVRDAFVTKIAGDDERKEKDKKKKKKDKD